MNLVALDSIVHFGFPERRLGRGSPSSIPTISKRKSIDYVGFPVRMKQILLRGIEWLEGLVQCVTGSMTSLSSIPVSSSDNQ